MIRDELLDGYVARVAFSVRMRSSKLFTYLVFILLGGNDQLETNNSTKLMLDIPFFILIQCYYTFEAMPATVIALNIWRNYTALLGSELAMRMGVNLLPTLARRLLHTVQATAVRLRDVANEVCIAPGVLIISGI